MSDLLQIGRTGVLAYQNALAAVGQNVVNAETPGYARRQVRQNEVTGGRPQPLQRSNINFNGVITVGVQRMWDTYKATDARMGASDAGRADARSRWLSTLETALDDGPIGVGKQLTAVFNAGDALAADPASAAPRRQFLLAIDGAAGALRATATHLATAAAGIHAEATTALNAANNALAALVQVNRQLHRASPGSTAQAEAMDQRDLLLDDLSRHIGYVATFDAAGAVELTSDGATGQTLLDGVNPVTIGMGRAADGRLSFSLADATGAPQVLSLTGGSLAGLQDAANVSADRRLTLDAIATDFANQLNAWSAAGRDKGGAPGAALLAPGAGKAATIAAIPTDPDDVAAASAISANGNAIALGNLRGAGGLEARWSATVSNHAQILAAARAEASAATTRRDNAFAARDSESGIDLDAEAADLLRFQQAYSGSAKVIQAARETLQDILNLF